jgi:hypothetical protein
LVGHGFGDPLRGVEVGGEGLLDEERQTRLQHGPLGRTVGEGWQAQPDRVEAPAGEKGRQVGKDLGAVLVGECSGPVGVQVRDSHEADVRQCADCGGVAGTDPPGPR